MPLNGTRFWCLDHGRYHDNDSNTRSCDTGTYQNDEPGFLHDPFGSPLSD